MGQSAFANRQGSAPRSRRSAEQRERWRVARRFQVEAQQALGVCNVPFVMWLLLECLAELIAERNDAVPQVLVAERAGLSRQVASYWMDLMDEDGLIDRGPAPDGRAYRILMSDLGAETLKDCNARLVKKGLI
jgi:hypothetical protein